MVLLKNNNWAVVTTVEDADYAEVLHKCPKRLKLIGLSEWAGMLDEDTVCDQCHEKYPEDIQTTLALFNMHKTKRKSISHLFEEDYRRAWMEAWTNMEYEYDILGSRNKQSTIKVAGDGVYFTEVKDDTP